jgi:hypothetical protein
MHGLVLKTQNTVTIFLVLVVRTVSTSTNVQVPTICCRLMQFNVQNDPLCGSVGISRWKNTQFPFGDSVSNQEFHCVYVIRLDGPARIADVYVTGITGMAC